MVLNIKRVKPHNVNAANIHLQSDDLSYHFLASAAVSFGMYTFVSTRNQHFFKTLYSSCLTYLLRTKYIYDSESLL